MRWTTFPSPMRLAAAAVLAAALALPAAGALAGGRGKERVYDDSFGNLIILSPSGYKRIVVGMGYLAAEYGEARPVRRAERRLPRRHCFTPPVLWKGRSRMYGLADGEIPTPPTYCR